MARKAISGLYQKGGIWQIDKVFRGERLRESTGTSDRQEAEQYLIHRLEQLRQQKVYGVRRMRTWDEAATKFLIDNKDQPSIKLTAHHLKQLHPYLKDLPLTHIDDQALEPFVRDRLKGMVMPCGKQLKPVAPRTINISIERVIRVLSLCVRKWRDEERRPWLDSVPMLTRLDLKKKVREPYPMTWEEQSILFGELPAHLQTMALFKVNTGCREQEVCKLRWDWEIPVPELGTSVFLIPSDFGGRNERSGVKNGDERLVVLNNVAKSIIDKQRGLSKEWVFPYNGTAMHRMNDSAWKKARVRAAKLWQEENLRPAHPGYASIRVHDLKHTFGRRLRAAGVTQEDRKALLGHKNGSITSHYSGAELGHLIEAANMVSATDSRGPVLTILKRKTG
ncbi:tyrosine-type recombinase/integrase [Pseudomonas brassicacearum]|nr:tyrosine-type recombinase/integrase [Pseudomonas brassicacearum]EIK66956.1 site-specific recombinase, phage integrase family [Pseudomonas fluorescens Q8r1-96]KAB0523517.1 tyrosine-type recombinase/integrase [Pseudomonas brassicacearum subsp. brassicacearum]NJP61473.1 tyrosine-type recombinase/integrase [Pseudomonas brassicacearum]QEO79708.1 site-specific integrase [Pseudomonas brassicacearum]SDP69859.1 Phage integrase family protein [Pseudomonas brassicacearum]